MPPRSYKLLGARATWALNDTPFFTTLDLFYSVGANALLLGWALAALAVARLARRALRAAAPAQKPKTA